ncbi:MAG: Crossover junction endodeoxyribonuclease ruvC [uncultured bacterium (gcode 4)]|uniref:Crossover junction endodeoxyribonuclease RuvC n=1 Tax=uncultured bacterium (gcode 4) TaxID=1234023 RepID=K2FWK3_9BACT|nr:MAG: Crossover junction endodeoxyribonuclease ruvC [uncultured bacterium (gcode 4)]
MSIILGIDPGTTTTWFAVIEKKDGKLEILNFWTIETKPKICIETKLCDIWDDLKDIINEYKPQLCGIEKLFFLKNLKTWIDVAQARWVMVYLLSKVGIPILEYTPLEVKKWICWNGSAQKKQVQNALKIIYKLDKIPHPDDAADALAIAYIASLSKKLI